MEEAKCRGCGRKIIWAITAEGKNIPLDLVAPVYSVALHRIEDGTEVYTATRLGMTFVSHFATCPKANQFSGRNKEKTKPS